MTQLDLTHRRQSGLEVSMSRAIRSRLTVLALCFLAAGCPGLVSQEPERPENIHKSALTAGTVATSLTRGKTTKLQVLEAFGQPNTIQKGAGGLEQYLYFQTSSSAHGRTVGAGGCIGGIAGPVGLGGAGGASASGSENQIEKAMLKVTFDQNDVVKDYDFQVTKI